MYFVDPMPSFCDVAPSVTVPWLASPTNSTFQLSPSGSVTLILPVTRLGEFAVCTEWTPALWLNNDLRTISRPPSSQLVNWLTGNVAVQFSNV